MPSLRTQSSSQRSCVSFRANVLEPEPGRRRPPAMRDWHRVVIASGLSIALIACSATATAPTDGGMVDATGDWQLGAGTVDSGPFRIVENSPITMTVTG